MEDIEIRHGEWRAVGFEYQGELYWHIFGPLIADGFIDAISGKGVKEMKKLLAEMERKSRGKE